MPIALFTIGLISILGQVVLLRELNVAFYGVELIYLLALGFWLFWTATGSLVARRRLQPSADSVAILLGLFALVLPGDVLFIRDIRRIFSAVPGAFLPFSQQLGGMALALLPVGLLLGLLFQWAAKIHVSRQKTLAQAYAWESLGGVVGGISATLALKWGIQNWQLALGCGLIALIAGTAQSTGPKIWPRRIARAAAALILLVGLWSASDWDWQMTAWNHPNLLDSRDTPYGRVTITRLASQISVFQNDALIFDTEGFEAETFANLAALQHPAPRRQLLLGGGMEGIAPHLLQHRPLQLDYVELNPVMFHMLMRHLPPEVTASLRAAPLRIIFEDPRQFLQHCGQYDLILCAMAEPTSGETNRFYTREFFRQCQEHLAPGGVFCFRLKSLENLWTPPLARRLSSIYQALRSVFKDIVVLPGDTNYVVASAQPLPRDPGILSQRLNDRHLQTGLVTPRYIEYLYTNDRSAEIASIIQNTRSDANSDQKPTVYQFTLMLWLSQFFPRLIHADLQATRETWGKALPFAWVLLLNVPLLFFLSRYCPKLRLILLVAMAGLAGMILETVLILYYQVKSGVLFQDLGLLLTCFMGGLTLGSWAMHAAAKNFRNFLCPSVEQTIPDLLKTPSPPHLSRWLGVTLLLLFSLFSFFTALMVRSDAIAGLWATGLLLGLAGFFVAAVFAYASLGSYNEDPRKLISPLYAADLLGGGVGSLISSLLLLPLAGMSATAQWMGVLVAACLLLIWTAKNNFRF